ncbi:MAG: hypothetical protein AAF492_29745, partial [Verrucomicrobiota bacterium]
MPRMMYSAAVFLALIPLHLHAALPAFLSLSLTDDTSLQTLKVEIAEAEPQDWSRLIKTYEIHAGSLTLSSLNGELGVGHMVRAQRIAESSLDEARHVLYQALAILKLADRGEHSVNVTRRLDGFKSMLDPFEERVNDAESAYLHLTGALNRRLIIRWRQAFAGEVVSALSSELRKPDLKDREKLVRLLDQFTKLESSFAEAVQTAETTAAEKLPPVSASNRALQSHVGYFNRDLKKVRTFPFVENGLLDLQSEMLDQVDSKTSESGPVIDEFYLIRIALARTAAERA